MEKMYILKSPVTGLLYKSKGLPVSCHDWPIIWSGQADDLPTDFLNAKRFETYQPTVADVAKVDMVNHPPHYTKGSIEVIDYLKEKLSPSGYEGFLAGNILKYVSRYESKNGIEDLKKAEWYLKKLIELKSSN